ncbi:hypothetical protein [Cupriavidus sp. a3]|uniref:hypothetical protein n=1 Tax=Cupriavidus sp. a3 TaxID=3242158 RepID=UPI003D9C361D
MKTSWRSHSIGSVIRRVVQAHRAWNSRFYGSVVHGNDVEGSDLNLTSPEDVD